jgi:hypothetical protein
MVIEEFQRGLGNLENLTAKAPDDAPGREQIVALYAVFIARKANADHDHLG